VLLQKDGSRVKSASAEKERASGKVDIRGRGPEGKQRGREANGKREVAVTGIKLARNMHCKRHRVLKKNLEGDKPTQETIKNSYTDGGEKTCAKTSRARTNE